MLVLSNNFASGKAHAAQTNTCCGTMKAIVNILDIVPGYGEFRSGDLALDIMAACGHFPLSHIIGRRDRSYSYYTLNGASMEEAFEQQAVRPHGQE